MSTYLPTVFGENLMDVFDDFDRNFFRGFAQPERMLYGKNAGRMMKTDVKELDEGYELDVELPGFKKDEIKVELNNGYLTISTEKSLEKNEENSKGKMLRQERYAGTMQRSFYVGGSLTEEDIKAKYENGVLSLAIPKKEARKVPEKKQILIEG
ncbi:MAG: Hsp20/alpha crystallin family protein [Clostridia bacterium]|nr:Hsp20/alpha crystallin family protein [Clostridia bacterium]